MYYGMVMKDVTNLASGLSLRGFVAGARPQMA